MNTLELRVPPPFVTALFGLAMWGFSRFGPTIGLNPAARAVLIAVLIAIAAIFAVGGLISFKKAHTTVNPMAPDKTTALVTSGIYRLTRNPMYVGLLFVLLAWGSYLGSLPALCLTPLFFLYITRFQIVPEERVLQEKFNSDFERYKNRVRRWL